MKKRSKISSGIPVTRRAVIASAGFIPLAALTASAQGTPAALSSAQRRTLEAFVDRLVPKDENGPGAVECGAVDYIDRCLTVYLAAEKAATVDGLAGLNAFALRSQGSAFAVLSADQRDAVLTAIDGNGAPQLRGFFNRVRRLTLEGMFGDPSYGGNKNFAGWDLIGYPGDKLAVGPEDQKMATRPARTRKPLYGDQHAH